MFILPSVKIFLSHYLRYFSSNSLNDWRFLWLFACPARTVSVVLSIRTPCFAHLVSVPSFGADGQAGGEGKDADIGSWQ